MQYKSVSNENLINPDNWLGDDDEPLTGFDWKSGTQRVTTGLILWSDVFLYDGPKNDKLAIYLMDTQGLFDHKSSPVDNSRIFSLSTMISSVQILNLLNIIQENQLQYLQFATEYARYASSDDEKSPFQKLLILIRDWNSPDEYNYGDRGGNTYLSSFLEIHDHQTRELQSVRRYIRSSFDEIGCFLMPYPGKAVARNSTYDGRWREIDEDFLESLQKLFQFSLAPKKLTRKLINGVTVKPTDLLVFINNYVEKFKNKDMPEATSIYESTLDQQFRILVAKSVDLYVNAIAAHSVELQGEDDVNKLHATAKDKALKHFDSAKKFGTYSEGANFKRELQKKIEEVFQQWKKVSLGYIHTIQQQKLKTSQQVTEAKKAEVMDNEAKEKLELANKNVEEAKKALEQARFDTAEARRQAEELKKRSIEAEKQRAEAIEKEKQTREWLEKMTNDKEFFEEQYNEFRINAANNVGATLGNSQNENGFGGRLVDDFGNLH